MNTKWLAFGIAWVAYAAGSYGYILLRGWDVPAVGAGGWFNPVSPYTWPSGTPPTIPDGQLWPSGSTASSAAPAGTTGTTGTGSSSGSSWLGIVFRDLLGQGI